MKSIVPYLRVKGHLRAIAAVTPLLLAVMGMQLFPPPLLDLFVNGGGRVLLYNMCVLVLIPYFVIFVVALGELYLSRLEFVDVLPLKRADIGLMTFFAGAGLLTTLGFVLGLLGLLYFWVCFLIFIGIIYIYFLRPGSKQFANELWGWIKADSFPGSVRYVMIFLRAILTAVIAAVLLTKGILLELFKDGGLHQYFAYFADTRLNHSTWMDPGHPILYDYLAGRGQGVYLFLTSFTNQFTIQIISAIYIIVIGAVARQVISFLLSAVETPQGKTSFRIYLPDAVMLLVITSSLLQMEPARFHLQTGAFFLFLAWTAPLFFLFNRAGARWLFFAQIPILIAFPVTDGIFLAFIGFIYGVEIFSLLITKNRALLKFPLLSILIASASAVVSFSLNWLYVGIPDLQPAQLFIPFIVQGRFQQWSSLELLFYLDSSLSQSVGASSISIGRIISGAIPLISYPLNYIPKPVSTPLTLFYSAVVMGLVLRKGMRLYRSQKKWRISRQPHSKVFLTYWLTFTSFYFLNIGLTTLIQQASLSRMLLFMDVFPIITIFAIILFLTQPAGPPAWSETGKDLQPPKVLDPGHEEHNHQ